MRAARHADFGRLALEWPDPIQVESELRGRRLELRFDRPLTADLSAVPERLRGYIDALAPAEPDGLVIDLEAGVTTRLDVHDGRIVVLDLSLPDPARDAVELRTGLHDGYGRLVFDWTEPVAFESEAAGDSVTIAFARAAIIDISTLGRDLEPWLVEAQAVTNGGRSEVRLALRPGVRAEIFGVEDDRVVVDLHTAVGSPSQVAGTDPGPEPAGAPAVQRPSPPPILPAPVSRRAAAPRTDPSAQRAEPGSAALIRPAGGPPAPRNPSPPEPIATSQAGRPPAADPSAGVTGRETEPGSHVGIPMVDVARRPRPQGAGSDPAAARLRYGVAPTPTGGSLDFDWDVAVDAAVLIRAGHLWVVFAPPAGVGASLPAVIGGLDGFLGAARLVDAEGGVALRFPLRRPLGARVEQEGTRWRVVIGAEGMLPEPVALTRRGQPPRLRLATGTPIRPVRLTDPEVGDRLEIWPLSVAGRGQPTGGDLVQLVWLPTVQGLTWRARADGVHSASTAGGIEVVAPGGLMLSTGPEDPTDVVTPAGLDEPAAPALVRSPPWSAGAADDAGGPTVATPTTGAGAPATTDPIVTTASRLGHDTGAQLATPAGTDAGTPVLGLAGWHLAPGETADDRRMALRAEIGRRPPAERAAARLELARFLLARARGPEALAVLDADPAEDRIDPAMASARRALTGAAEFLMGRLAEAGAKLGAPELGQDREVALWRAALAAEHRDWVRAHIELGRSAGILASYPPALQLRLGLPAAMIAIASGEPGDTEALLKRLARLRPDAADRARFVEGWAAARAGRVDDADRIWRGLETSRHFETRVESAHARTMLRLEAGEITPAEALDQLATARALWRGHPWEPVMLDDLAEVHLAAGDPAGAIRAWHDLRERAPGSPDDLRIAGQMRRTFVTALLAEDGGGLDPVRAHALLREFPELVPEGEVGVRLRRRLAAQLTQLDLIEPAAALLGQVMAAEPVGPARAEAGAALAVLQLRLPDPAAALATLDATSDAPAPAALQADRRLLRARALTALGRHDEALAVLDPATDPAAARLRVDVLWRAEAWARLAGAIEPMLDDRGVDGAPLTEDDQTLLVRLAIAHDRLGDGAALDRLRTRFAPAVHGTPIEPAFLMATAPAGRPGTPAAVLAAAETGLGRVRRYLDALPGAPAAGGR